MFERPHAGENTLLIHIKRYSPWLSADLLEFKELSRASGAVVCDIITNRQDQLNSKYLIGPGKLEEIKNSVIQNDIELVIFNSDLSPSQERNLEKELKCRVLDRTGLILDIFAKRAKTYEGKLQVELAQLQHLSTRLVRGWTHLERQKGGIGLRGPGEKQLELDRRMLRVRVTTIKRKLEKVKSQRSLSRQQRQKSELATVALVGYTNAGKSTLFRTLTNHNVFVADQLFATLDPTLKIVNLPKYGKLIFADTVGFIRDLPHDLVDAFKATLEEVTTANLLLHVIDCNDDLWYEKKQQVESVLAEINAQNIPTLEVYNKIDLRSDLNIGYETDHNGIVARVRISAYNQLGIAELEEAVCLRLCKDVVRCKLVLPQSKAKVRAQLYNLGAIEGESINEHGDYVLQISLMQTRWNSLLQEYPDLGQMVE